MPLTHLRKNFSLSLQQDEEFFQAGARELRSTYATMAAAAGIQPKTLQHIMGHAKSQLTMDIYVKQDSKGMQIASGQLENFLERGVPNVPAFVPNPEVA